MSDDLSGPKGGATQPKDAAALKKASDASKDQKNLSDEQHGDREAPAKRSAPPGRRPNVLMQFSDIWHAFVHTVIGSAEFALIAFGALILHGFTHVLVHFGLIDGVAWRTLVFAPTLRELIALVGDAAVYCVLKTGEIFLLLLDLAILIVKTARQLKK
ncbi:hypothetical protein AWB80_05017 [Caballeronia pedi]|uniref:Uncharacterized protein n=1 Tax=Caballeronia pedi TaxID=1777141 RepID=A0A158CCX0_9BURK|nr:hypothetical protein [Caballeronia pedi]SAK80132.1 hypothetical protein AWB80_05017 [Caballeronia pedi]